MGKASEDAHVRIRMVPRKSLEVFKVMVKTGLHFCSLLGDHSLGISHNPLALTIYSSGV